MLIKPSAITQTILPIFTKGKTICTGTAVGRLFFNRDLAVRKARDGENIIWITNKLTNDDLCHIHHFKGVITLSEDPSSHAAIILRISDIPSLTFIQDSRINKNQLHKTDGKIIHEGDYISIDAFNQIIIPEKIPLFLPNQHSKELLDQIMSWCKSFSHVEIHSHSDTPQEASHALKMGATGIDPRSEHMFFQPERLSLFRQLILAHPNSKKNALAKLKDLQKQDFIQLFEIMRTLPAKIRLLDPPLHEFLPRDKDTIKDLARELNIPLLDCEKIINSKEEVNPMMGHRGVRLLLTYPQIIEMQVEAIFEAAIESPYKIIPHINLPMVIDKNEVILIKNSIDETLRKVCEKYNTQLNYKLGIMVETPRACLLADEIAPYIDFVSFGTNDLTGQTLALSRGDVYESFLKHYLDNKIIECDPFVSLDRAVQKLIEITVTKLRDKNPNIVIGICGEQGAEEKSVTFLCKTGLNSITCSPARVPVIYLFAAQAAIMKNQIDKQPIHQH